jgi:hypothetical protein
MEACWATWFRHIARVRIAKQPCAERHAENLRERRAGVVVVRFEAALKACGCEERDRVAET